MQGSGQHIGPVVNKAQYEKIQGLIQTGIDEGARLVSEAGWLGLSSDGPPVEVTAQDLDGGVTNMRASTGVK